MEQRGVIGLAHEAGQVPEVCMFKKHDVRPDNNFAMPIMSDIIYVLRLPEDIIAGTPFISDKFGNTSFRRPFVLTVVGQVWKRNTTPYTEVSII